MRAHQNVCIDIEASDATVKSLLLIFFYATNIIKLNYSKASIELSPAFVELPNLITHFWAQATLAAYKQPHSKAIRLIFSKSN